MNQLQPIRFYLALLAFFIAALVGGTSYFLVGLSESSYLVSDGVRVGLQYLNKPRYDLNLQGLIFSLSFLLAGLLLILLMIMPDERAAAGSRAPQAPPQPRKRTAPGTPAPSMAETPGHPAAATATTSATGSATPATPAGGAAHPAQPSPLTIEQAEAESGEPQPAPAPQPKPGVSVEEEVLKTADDLPSLDLQDSRFEDSGDEDVVYGNGRITEDAVWEFVQQYPDSAVKFLYRKTLDNKPLSPTEEDIYRNWENRGMTRARVREVVLEIMRWQSLPDNFPHNIWRELRDEIYEMQTR